MTKQEALVVARRAARRAHDARRGRDEAIRAAAGVASLREVAEATGLSKPRIQQIVGDGRRPED